MEPIIYKPGAYKSPGIYNGAGGIYKGRGVYNDGAGGGGPVVPPGYTQGVLRLLTGTNALDLNSNKVKVSTTCIFEMEVYITGGDSGWSTDFTLFKMNNTGGSTRQLTTKTNLTNNQTRINGSLYNTTSSTAITKFDVLSIYSDQNELLVNGDNRWQKNGRIDTVWESNGINRIFSYGQTRTSYSGSLFYKLSIKENDIYTNYIVPCKKSDNTIVLLDLITLDEYSVNSTQYALDDL